MFQSERFENAVFEPRTESVSVPALADFFDSEEDAEWTVRGLNSNELHKAMESGATRKTLGKVVEAISESGQIAADIRKAIGMTKETPGEMAKRLEMLVAGSVSPKVSWPMATKLAENFPIEFLTLTNKITTLTGMGSEMVKPAAASQQIAN